LDRDLAGGSVTEAPPYGPAWDEARRRLTEHLVTLEDKPEDTVDATLAALWHLAGGHRLSARAAMHEALAPLDADGQKRFAGYLEARLSGVPLAYLTERQSFLGFEMIVGEGALIPRAETEILGRAAIAIVRDLRADSGSIVIADVCTGAGNIAAAMALSRSDVVVQATDIASAALDVARRNLAHLGLADRVELRQGDLLDALDEGSRGRIALITCNPPYLSDTRRSTMPVEIAEHEPQEAFDGGPLGLRIIQRLVRQAATLLRPGGWLAFEVGAGQGPGIIDWMGRHGSYVHVRPVTDDRGTIRAVVARTAMDAPSPSA
jgi:release factor glutamine methyltransferase